MTGTGYDYIRPQATPNASKLPLVGVQTADPIDSPLVNDVLAMAWTCLMSTPHLVQQCLYARVFETYDKLEQAFLDAKVTFTPGLAEVLSSPTPPPSSFFETLMTPSDKEDCWGVYYVVMEYPEYDDEDDVEPYLYIWSGTESMGG